MDLRSTALTSAAHLIGITFTLRKIYKPSFAVTDAIAVALSRIDRRESAIRR
jgi:hypothetical protein